MKYLFLLGCSCAVLSPAMAQDTTDSVSPKRSASTLSEGITVVATGSELRLDEAAQSISVMGADEIDSIQSPDITTVLRRLPGVTFNSNGGLGSVTGVTVRGANSSQLLVLIDGIRVADVAAPGGGYDFGNLISGGFGKIELLRGSNSVVWGSEAIGGVLALTTKELDGIEASAEYGARDSVNAQATAGLGGDSYNVTVTGGYSETDGFSSAASGTENDAFRQWRIAGRGELALTGNLSATFAGRYADSRVEFDGFSFSPPYALTDTSEYTETEEVSARAGLRYSDERLGLDAAYSIYDIDRANFNPDFGTDPNFTSQGRQERAELKGRFNATSAIRLDFGADHEWSRFETSYEPGTDQKADLTSGHALLGWYGDGFTVAAGARIDDHSRFGSEVTFGANGAFDVVAGWRVRASYGEGFKVPSLYQLFSDFGNPGLAPERSKSYELGIEKGDRNARLHFAATAFRRDSRNLIDFASCFSVSDALCDDGRFGFYVNTGKARAEGFEVELGARPTQHLHAQAAYSYVKAVNRTPGDANFGNDLARRPRHAVSVALDWTTPLAGLELGGDIRMVSGSFDNASNLTRLDGYALGAVRASLPVNDMFELFGRVENVTDEVYQTSAGYGTAGRSAYIGARARF